MQLIRSGHKEGAPTAPLTANTTGQVFFDVMFMAKGCASGNVTFTPGSRTYWHTHEEGQILYVTQGCGLIQSEGEAAMRLQVGDVVHIPGGEKHWHGAAKDTIMTHTAVALGGCDWHDEVSESEYQGAHAQVAP